MIPAQLLGLLLVVAGPQSFSPDAAPLPRNCSIEGTVVSRTTGAPVKKAHVVAANLGGSGETREVITDSNGRFVMSQLAPGQYGLGADRIGFMNGGLGQQVAGDPPNRVTLAAGATATGIVIRLTPTAAISGQVMDQDGDPVQGADVGAFQVNWANGRREQAFLQQAQTNDLGNYRIFGLPPGKYYLSASYPNNGQGVVIYNGQVEAVLNPGGNGEGAAEQTYVPTYYPGTIDPASAQPVELNAGDDVSAMDFAILPTRAVEVRGQITNGLTGGPAGGVCVNLQPREASNVAYMLTRSGCAQGGTGNFVVPGVVPGRYVLTAGYWQDQKSLSARLPLDVGESDVEGANVVLLPAMTVKGYLAIEGNTQLKPENVQLSLFPTDQPGSPAAWAQVKSDGTFIFENVPQGVYRVGMNGYWGDIYVKSTRLGNRVSADEAITIDRDIAGERLQVEMSARAGYVDGVVLDQDRNPAPRAVVVLVPELGKRNRDDLFRDVQTGDDGHFNFGGLPPGQYKIFAWPRQERTAYRDSDWLAPYENLGTPVRISEGDRQDIEVRVISLKSPSE